MYMAKGHDLKNENLKTVRKCFYYGNTCSAADVIRETGLSHGSVINVIRELLDRGEIKLVEKSGSTVGRKTNYYAVNPEIRSFLTFEVRRTEKGFLILARRINLAGEVTDVYENEIAGRTETYFQEEISTMADRYPDTDMILVSTPGVCSDGVISVGSSSLDIGRFITGKYNIPYVIENDVNVAAIGFYAENRSENTAVVYQAAEEIFGCGIIIRGRLYNGFCHAAGELRYIPYDAGNDASDPTGLFRRQILTVAAVVNPEVIGYYSGLSDQDLSFDDIDMPEGIRPVFRRIGSLDTYIQKGLLSIGIHNLIEQTGGLKQRTE